MLQSFRNRRGILLLLVLLVVVGLGILTLRRREGQHAEPDVATKPGAPRDLQKLREVYAAGKAALQRNDGTDAVGHFQSFDFGDRAVEEYRLYYLANGHELRGDPHAARRTLARLWRRNPRLIYADDAAFHLAGLYSAEGDWAHAADVYSSLARRSEVRAVGAKARWRAVNARLHAGDVAGAFYSARNLLIRDPAAEEAEHAAALVRAVAGVAEDAPIPLTASERLDRATALVTAGEETRALAELATLEPVAPHYRQAIRLQRGIALHQLRRFEDSNEALEPIFSGYFKIAIPALRYSAKNHGALAASINPNIVKTVKERKRVGSVKVRVGKGTKRRTVTRPKYRTVFRKVTLVDLPKKKKKDEHERLSSERLKDLLSLPLDEEVRIETLNGLIARAEAKSQTEYLQELVPELLKIERDADPALQYFWDRAWAAWTRGDLGTAGPLFRFIADTYTNPNVRRQSDYWWARTIERQGKKKEAAEAYRRLASAPYADLYAIHSVSRGARRQDPPGNPLRKEGPDWTEIADHEMPDELRLAYELTSLADMREAVLEVRRNMGRKNARFAEALLADVYHSQGNELLMYRSIRRAWPQLATVEQDSVPAYFLRMYYPMKFQEPIEENAADQGLDPNLVRALILQESYYNPEAKSRVGATGLMQLMPPTASEHAKRLRIPFAASRLENPDINVRLGTYHLRMLLRLFSGNVYFAVAAYNAGQGNVAKWRRAAPKRPMDEFIEAIPFQETRNYVKRVTMLRSAYRRMTS